MTNTVTIIIILATSVASFMAFNNRAMFEKYLFIPYAIKNYKEHYRFLSHGFFHADWMHLLFNMFVLYSFGSILESAYFPNEADFGNKSKLYYILLYTGSLYASSAVDYARHKNNPSYSSVGASGAVNAVLFSCILINPWSRIYMFFIPFGIPAWIFGVLFLIYSFYMDKKNVDNVGHGAHAWGAIFGFLFTGLLNVELFLKFFTQLTHP